MMRDDGGDVDADMIMMMVKMRMARSRDHEFTRLDDEDSNHYS